MANHTTILKEAFNLEILIWLPQMKPPRSGSDTIKYCRYERGIGHNIEDCQTQKDKIEELIQAGYLAQFVKRTKNHQVGPRPRGHQEDQCGNQEADRRRAEERGKQRHQQHPHKRQPPPQQEPAQHIRGVINTIDGGFSYEG